MKTLLFAVASLLTLAALPAHADMWFDCKVYAQSDSIGISGPARVELDIAERHWLKEDGVPRKGTRIDYKGRTITVSYTGVTQGVVKRVTYTFDRSKCDSYGTGSMNRTLKAIGAVDGLPTLPGATLGSTSLYKCGCNED